MKKTIVITGALDTKGEDFVFLKERIENTGIKTLVVDFGVMEDPLFKPHITREEVAEAGGGDIKTLSSGTHKDKAMRIMSEGLAVIIHRLYKEGLLDGIIGMGGSGGTSIASTAMRVLPIGVPKVMVSTVGGGDITSYTGTKDITFIPSIVDVAGLNRISRIIYTNAAGAITGMVKMEAPSEKEDKPIIAASMYGNTTPCVGHARQILEDEGFEVLTFHTTGTGGRVMENLIQEGYFSGVLDITTTELADEVCAGVLSAGPDRLLAASRRGIPAVIVPGCVDIAVFQSRDSMPEKYKNRNLYQWNPDLTLMRTNIDENRRIGEMIAAAANAAIGPVKILFPLKGVSMLDSLDEQGNPGIFWDPEADKSCFDAVKSNVNEGVSIEELDCNINNEKFSRRCAELLLEMLHGHSEG